MSRLLFCSPGAHRQHLLRSGGGELSAGAPSGMPVCHAAGLALLLGGSSPVRELLGSTQAAADHRVRAQWWLIGQYNALVCVVCVGLLAFHCVVLFLCFNCAVYSVVTAAGPKYFSSRCLQTLLAALPRDHASSTGQGTPSSQLALTGGHQLFLGVCRDLHMHPSEARTEASLMALQVCGNCLSAFVCLPCPTRTHLLSFFSPSCSCLPLECWWPKHSP